MASTNTKVTISITLMMNSAEAAPAFGTMRPC